MGNVLAEITVKNAIDIGLVRLGQITENDVRTVALTAVVDTGATTLVINEEIFNQLGLTVEGTRTINIAGGAKVECKITSPVLIKWKDREASVSAMMLPQGKPLLGVIPLEYMDLIVDPKHNELIGVHGDEVLLMVMPAGDYTVQTWQGISAYRRV
jgi:clan AA aspartic protease